MSELISCLAPEERLLIERVRAAMSCYFGADEPLPITLRNCLPLLMPIPC